MSPKLPIEFLESVYKCIDILRFSSRSARFLGTGIKVQTFMLHYHIAIV